MKQWGLMLVLFLFPLSVILSDASLRVKSKDLPTYATHQVSCHCRVDLRHDPQGEHTLLVGLRVEIPRRFALSG